MKNLFLTVVLLCGIGSCSAAEGNQNPAVVDDNQNQQQATVALCVAGPAGWIVLGRATPQVAAAAALASGGAIVPVVLRQDNNNQAQQNAAAGDDQ